MLNSFEIHLVCVINQAARLALECVLFKRTRRASSIFKKKLIVIFFIFLISGPTYLSTGQLHIALTPRTHNYSSQISNISTPSTSVMFSCGCTDLSSSLTVPQLWGPPPPRFSSGLRLLEQTLRFNLEAKKLFVNQLVTGDRFKEVLKALVSLTIGRCHCACRSHVCHVSQIRRCGPCLCPYLRGLLCHHRGLGTAARQQTWKKKK